MFLQSFRNRIQLDKVPLETIHVLVVSKITKVSSAKKNILIGSIKNYYENAFLRYFRKFRPKHNLVADLTEYFFGEMAKFDGKITFCSY